VERAGRRGARVVNVDGKRPVKVEGKCPDGTVRDGRLVKPGGPSYVEGFSISSFAHSAPP
jgi:hypothetical protein